MESDTHLEREENSTPEKEASSLSIFEQLLAKQLVNTEDCLNAPIPGNTALEDISLEERLNSANWEWRLHGITELKKTLTLNQEQQRDSDGENFCPFQYSSQLETWLSDRNANVQREAVELTTCYFKSCKQQEAVDLWEKSSLYNVILEKCLSQPRLSQHTADCLASALSVLETSLFLQPIYATLEAYVDASGRCVVRGPPAKQLLGLLGALEKLIRFFGSSALEPPKLIPRVSPYCSVTDASVKKAAYACLLEFFLWTQDETLVACALQDKQKAELLRRCQDATSPQPLVATHYFRRATAPPKGSFVLTYPISTAFCRLSSPPSCSGDTAAGGAGVNDRVAVNGPETAEKSQLKPVDAFEHLPEKDIFREPSLERWEKRLTGAEKWQEKQEVIDALTQACDRARRLKPGDYSIFVSPLLRVVQNEGNIVVTVAGIKAFTALANVLRKHFAPYLKSVAGAGLLKLRDRNKPLLTATLSLLSALLLCGPFDVYLEDVAKIVYDKQANARDYALQWCAQVLNHPSQRETVQRCFSKIVTFALDSMEDATLEVRNRAAQLTASLVASPKADIVYQAIELLPPKHAQTIQDALARVSAKADETSSTVLPTLIGSSKPSSTVRQASAHRSTSRVNQSVGRSTNRTRAPSVTSSKSRCVGPPASDESKDHVSEITLDPAVAQDAVLALLGEERFKFLSQQFTSSDWKNRVEAFEQCLSYLPIKTSVVFENYTQCDAVCVWLRYTATKSFTETNVNVNKAALLLAVELPQIYGCSFTSSCGVMFLTGFIDKLSDGKLGPLVKDLALRYAKVFSPRLVLQCAVTVKSSKASTPKARVDMCSLAEAFILQFGARPCGPQALANYARSLLDNRSPTVRSGAMRLLAILYRCLPNAFPKFLGHDSQSASLLSAVTSLASTLLIEEVAATAKNESQSRLSVESSSCASATVIQDIAGTTDGTTSEPLRGTGNLKAYLTPAFYKNVVDPKWAVRKDALIKLLEGITKETVKGQFIAHQDLTDLFVTLRGRLKQEPNRSVTRELILVVDALAKVLGPNGIKCYTRMILPSVFQKFSDKTPAIREASRAAAVHWLTVGGISSWLNALLTSQILTGSGDEREPLVGILAGLDDDSLRDSLLSQTETQTSFKALLPILMELLQGRNKVLRLHAETCLIRLASFLPPLWFQKAFQQLKPAHQAGARTVVAQCIEQASTSSVFQDVQGVSVPLSHPSMFNTCNSENSPKQGSSLQSKPSALPRSATVSVYSNEFVLKLTVLSHTPTVTKLEAYRRTRWTSIPSPEDVELLYTIWKLFGNNKLLSAMFEKLQSSTHQQSAFQFWDNLFTSELEKLHLLLTPRGHHDQGYLIDLVIRWIIVRIIDSNPKSALAGCSTLLTLMESLKRHIVAAESVEFSVASTALLHSALPQLLERLPLVTGHIGQLRDKFHEVIRNIVLWCQPQATFLMLMRTTGSPNKKVVAYALEELAVICQKNGPDVCHNVKRDIAKLTTLASAHAEAGVKTAALRVLAALHAFMGYPLVTAIPQNDVREKLLAFLKRHPPPVVAEASSGVTVDDADTVAASSKLSPSKALQLLPHRKSPLGQQDDRLPLSISGSETKVEEQRASTSVLAKDTKHDDICIKLGLRNYCKEFATLLETAELEERLESTDQALKSYADEVRKKELQLFVQDLAEDCRRVREGRLRPNAAHIAYWNGVMRVNETQHSARGLSLVLLDLLRTLHRPDPTAVIQSAEALHAIFESFYSADKKAQLEGGQTQRDWQVVFSSELADALIVAIHFCFIHDKSSVWSAEDTETFRVAAIKVSRLATQVVRNRKLLQRISIVQLRDLYRVLIGAMSSRLCTNVISEKEEPARSLSCLLSRDLMAIIIPRNASHLILMFFDFLLYHRDALHPSLVLRTHRKLIHKISVKHGDRSLTSDDIRYYIRILDVAVLLLKQLDSDPTFAHIPALYEIGPPYATSSNAIIKGQLELLIQEIIFISIVVIGPSFAGVYFRDAGFVQVSSSSLKVPAAVQSSRLSSPGSTTPEARAMRRVHRRLSSRLEALMNTTYSLDFVKHLCPSLATSATSSNEIIPSSYEDWYHYHQQSQRPLQTPLLKYPLFSLSYFLSVAAPDVTLESLDSDIAVGWSSRRDVQAGLDIKALCDFLPQWSAVLEDVKRRFLPATLDTTVPAQQATWALNQGLVPYELVGKYVRKTLNTASQCGLIIREDIPDTPLYSTLYA